MTLQVLTSSWANVLCPYRYLNTQQHKKSGFVLLNDALSAHQLCAGPGVPNTDERAFLNVRDLQQAYMCVYVCVLYTHAQRKQLALGTKTGCAVLSPL